MNESLAQQPEYKITVKNLTKKFSRKLIFKDLNFELNSGSSLSITGRNGSGKSTLIKILAGLLEKTSGETEYFLNGNIIKSEDIFKYIGFVSPYLNLYDEFSGYENLKFFAELRGLDEQYIDEALKRTGLYSRKDDLVKIYSSGMKQRLKIAFAVLHKPSILLLDEPTSNLDKEGVKIVEDIANEFSKNKILVIATNDEFEKNLCKEDINLDF
jgi:heme exporter protein A